MNPTTSKLVQEFKARLPADIAKHIVKCMVFGSMARGDDSGGSDLDLMVITRSNPEDVEKTLDEVAYSVMWDHDFNPVISLKVCREEHFNDFLQRGFSFYRNVQNEGITV